MRIAKTIEWDMGHRVTNHASLCRNLHGHRYKAEIWVEGNLVNIDGNSAQGMVIDFGDIKKIAKERICDVLDHSFMVWEKDELVLNFFKQNPEQRHIIVPFVPTAENIAGWMFVELNKGLQDKYQTGLKLQAIKLWETPNSVAECAREDVEHD